MVYIELGMKENFTNKLQMCGHGILNENKVYSLFYLKHLDVKIVHYYRVVDDVSYVYLMDNDKELSYELNRENKFLDFAEYDEI